MSTGPEPARRRVIIGAIIAVLIPAGWYAAAQIGSTGTINGCLSPSGFIRGTDEETGVCRQGDVALSWYSKTGADAQFLTRAGKAADADLLDGLDSSHFLTSDDLAALSARVATLEAAAAIGPEVCADGIDNDVDGLTDCADPACSTDPACTAEVCDDGLDNDANGETDCEDNACYESAACRLPLDVVFLIDTTGDMGAALGNVKTSIIAVQEALRAEVPDVMFGLATFQDFPTSPYGAPGDQPYRLILPLDHWTLLVGGVAGLAAEGGGDLPESGNEALYQLASGAGTSEGGAAVPPGDIGFRAGSNRIVIVVTSAAFHDYTDYTFPTHSRVQAIAQLNAAGAHVVGILVASSAPPPEARVTLIDYAMGTGAVVPASTFSLGGSCATGVNGSARVPLGSVCPLVFEVDWYGTGLSDSFVPAILSIQ